jgi:IS1 family transposase
MMVEGVSIRSIARLTGASKNTILKLLEDAGRVCSEYQDKVMRELPCKRVQVDEIWSFIQAKEKNVPAGKKGLGIGDVWTWTALDAETKLIPSWFVGSRDADHARYFISDLASRMGNRIQLTSDGHKPYLNAVKAAFGRNVDYAQLVKIYGKPSQSPEAHRRYSPTPCIGATRQPEIGNPDPAHISTSYAERQNLNIRMGVRRFTRLTNAFSKKMENHVHALSIYFMHHNFIRIQPKLRVTPAMAAKVTDKLWSMDDVVALVEANEPPPKKRGSYKKRAEA